MRIARIQRQGRLAAVAAALTLLSMLSIVPTAQATVVTPAGSQISSPAWAARAQASYAALQSHLYLGNAGNDFYLDSFPKVAADAAYTDLFPAREATEATIDVSRLPHVGTEYNDDVAARFVGISHYFDTQLQAWDSAAPPPYNSAAGDPYYDDNSIVGLSFVKQYRLSKDSSKLAEAQRAFRFVQTGWDTNPATPCAGGEHWVDASWNPTRATNATILAAELAVRLYLATGNHSYLDWGTRAYTWVQTCVKQAPGLYSNDEDFTGKINPTLWTYNSGAAIGTATLLYQATGRTKYLQAAISDAHGALSYWLAGDRYYDQPAVFNAYFFADLLLLDSVQPNTAYRQAISHYADLIWARNRDPQTGLFSFQAGGGGRPTSDVRPQTLEQSAVVQTFALLGWPNSRYADAV